LSESGGSCEIVSFVFDEVEDLFAASNSENRCLIRLWFPPAKASSFEFRLTRRADMSPAAGSTFTEPSSIRRSGIPRQEKFWKRRNDDARSSFHELNFDRNLDVLFLVRVTEKSSDGCASDRTIVAGKFVHVHPDERTDELPVHVARECE
jgi:hypothetical protein